MKYKDQYNEFTERWLKCSYNTFIANLKKGITADEMLKMDFKRWGVRVKASMMDTYKEMKAKWYKHCYSTMVTRKHYIYINNIELINEI
jgi:hypothetical protein